MKVKKLVNSWKTGLPDAKVRFYKSEYRNRGCLNYEKSQSELISSDIPIKDVHSSWLNKEVIDWWFDGKDNVDFVNLVLDLDREWFVEEVIKKIQQRNNKE